MSVENPLVGYGEGQDNSAPVELTPEEYKNISSNEYSPDDRLKFLAERGLKPDAGPIKVIVGGKELFIQTDSEDLGTITDKKEVRKINKKKIDTQPGNN